MRILVLLLLLLEACRGPARRAADASLLGGDAGALGEGLQRAGDVNGDGFADLLFKRDRRSVSVGAGSGVDLLFGRSAWTGLRSDWKLSGPFVHDAVVLGDTNGDGYDDIILRQTEGGGAPLETYFYLGDAVGLVLVDPLRTSPVGVPFYDAYDVGDLDADGYADALLFGGSSGPLSLRWGEQVEPLQRRHAFDLGPEYAEGIVINAAGVGDADGDGLDDLVVLHGVARGLRSSRRSLLFIRGSLTGPPSGPWSSPVLLDQWVDEDTIPKSMAEAADCLLGKLDFDGNGIFDFVAGGMNGVKVFMGSAGEGPWKSDWYAGTKQVANFDNENNFDEWHGTCSAIGGGDLNGDGYDDLVIGAPGWNFRREDVGRVDAYYGGVGGLSQDPTWSTWGDRSSYQLGESLAVLDLNGDGLADVVVGVPVYDLGTSRVGRIDIFWGRKLPVSG